MSESYSTHWRSRARRRSWSALIAGSICCSAAANAAPNPPNPAQPNPPDDSPPSAERPNYVVPLLHDVGLLSALRVGEALLWPEPFANFHPRFVARSYADAYSSAPRWEFGRPAFEWDGDAWNINVIGHGLLGSELYLRARLCHHTPWVAAAFAVGGSAAWEYAFEASAVRPSALDLVYTPLAGAALGEMRFGLWRWARRQRTTLAGMFRVVLDPLGEFERGAGSGC